MLSRIYKLIPILLAVSLLFAADPTFLRRRVPEIQPRPDDLTANARLASYKPIFGIGDPDAKDLKSVARYGELTVGPKGTSALVSYPAEEQIYYILDGNGILLYGNQKVPVKRNDFVYLPPRIKHGIANSFSRPIRLMVMGFRIPTGTHVPPTPKLMLANADDVKLQALTSYHGQTVRYKLLMGTTNSKRDRLAAATVMVSLFIMDFAPKGTNIPHHHDTEEEIYYIMRGQGDMVAGGGLDGNEGRHPAKAGDAYFIRLNATVGFYSKSKQGEPHDLILAVRSKYPFTTRRY